MPDRPSAPLHGRRVLVVEDEYVLAEELRDELERLGADVLGPVAAVGDALDLLAREALPDVAVLDVNLGGEMIYSAADLLAERGVPFMLATGYDVSMIPARFGHIVRCEKPINFTQVTRAIERMLSGGPLVSADV